MALKVVTLLFVSIFTAFGQELPSHHLEVNGQLWYQECGSASTGVPNIVLLHDGLLNSMTWDEVWAPLCSKYHVVRYDRRGYGKSAAAKQRFVPEDDVVNIMHAVRMERAFLIGNSSGAGLAIDFAIAHPEMTDGLLLIGPVVHGMPSSAYFNKRGEANSAPMDHDDAKAAAKNWSQDRFLISGPNHSARQKLYDGLVNNPQNLKVPGQFEIRPSPPSYVRLSEIKVPVVVVVGESDIADVFAYAGAIEASAPLATFEVWKDAGHLIQLEHPAELVARLDRLVPLALRKEVHLNRAQLEPFLGRYRFANNFARIILLDDHLVAEIPGSPYYRLFAASESRFFLRVAQLEIEFQKDKSGNISELTVHNSDGSVVHCPRMEPGSSSEPTAK